MFIKKKLWFYILLFVYGTLNTRLSGTCIFYARVHVYFNYIHFNTVSKKTHTIVLLNTCEIETLNTNLIVRRIYRFE